MYWEQLEDLFLYWLYVGKENKWCVITIIMAAIIDGKNIRENKEEINKIDDE